MTNMDFQQIGFKVSCVVHSHWEGSTIQEFIFKTQDFKKQQTVIGLIIGM